ncbi:MAG: Hsp20/alpha crystallin family protein [Chloroflexi bacterium]|nr:Hsp20/alpha crystallin family protein [Chloroflexota bacterium]
MSNLTRWQPIRDMMSLRDAMDHFFDDTFNRELGFFEGFSYPVIDMYQTDEDVVLKAMLPGLRADDVRISVTGDVLTLSGEIKEEQEDTKATYHIRERRYGSFTRTIPLPAPVVTEKAKADFENGVLKLTLPKAEEVKPKTISVKAK